MKITKTQFDIALKLAQQHGHAWGVLAPADCLDEGIEASLIAPLVIARRNGDKSGITAPQCTAYTTPVWPSDDVYPCEISHRTCSGNTSWTIQPDGRAEVLRHRGAIGTVGHAGVHADGTAWGFASPFTRIADAGRLIECLATLGHSAPAELMAIADEGSAECLAALMRMDTDALRENGDVLALLRDALTTARVAGISTVSSGADVKPWPHYQGTIDGPDLGAVVVLAGLKAAT